MTHGTVEVTVDDTGADPPARWEATMRLINRIVVGWDGSPDAVTTLDWAKTHARTLHLPLTVVHVTDEPPWCTAHPRHRGVERAASVVADDGAEPARIDANATSAPSSGTCPDGGVAVTPHIRADRVAEELVSVSGSTTMLVVGARSHRGLDRAAVRHRVALAVAVRATGPMIVVPAQHGPSPGPERPVVVGVDGSACDVDALRLAADMALDCCAPLTIVAAYRQGTGKPVDRPWALEGHGIPLFDTDSHHAVAEIVAERAARVHRDHPCLTLSTQIQEGAPARVLMHAAADAGLLVIGTRRHITRDGSAASALGPMAYSALLTATCPVAVMPEPWRPDAPMESPAPASVSRPVAHDSGTGRRRAQG